ncbi:hypothetical protein PHSC3_002007 [Chlamydiales bacterium STE3]|nr:hypothetical protein PHSC3_002007 [Chlamydiales bacterium STE3]
MTLIKNGTSIITAINNFGFNDTISFSNGKFSRVNYWGKLIRLVKSVFLCRNEFKDCNPKFIARKMVALYETEKFKLSLEDQKRTYATIQAYIQRKFPKSCQSLLSPIASKEESDKKKALQSERLIPNLNSPESSHIQEREVDLEWQQAFSNYEQGQLNANELKEMLKKKGPEQLDPKLAVKLFAHLDLEIDSFPWTKEQRAALNKYLIKKTTQDFIEIKSASWEEIVAFITNLSEDAYKPAFFDTIANKSTSALTAEEALVIYEFLKNKPDLLLLFTQKLESAQIGEIVINLLPLEEVDNVKRLFSKETLFALCCDSGDLNHIEVFWACYGDELSENEILDLLPTTVQELFDLLSRVRMNLMGTSILVEKLLNTIPDDSFSKEFIAMIENPMANDTFIKNISCLDDFQQNALQSYLKTACESN